MVDEDQKGSSETVNADIIDAVFEETFTGIEEDDVLENAFVDENDTTPDIAFQANDEDYW